MTTLMPLLADITSGGYKAGQLFGSFLMPLLCAIGILKYALLLRRPGTSRVCVTALLLTFCGWLFGATGYLLTLFIPSWESALKVTFGMLNIICNLSAFIVAIVGLASYDSSRFNKGRGQAVFSLVLNGLLLVSGIAMMAKARQNEKGEIASHGKQGQLVRNEDYNFSIEPAAGWTPTKAKQLNELACNAFRHFRPEGYFIVIGEHLDDYNVEDYMEIVKENLNGSASSVRDDSLSELEINGIHFKRRTCVAEIHSALGLPMYFDQYVATRPGYAWQFMFWCPEKSRHQLEPDFEKTMQTFRILDEGRSVPPEKGVINVEYRDLGFRTAVDPKQWSAWKQEDIPLSEFNALRNLEAMMVLPISLPASDCPLEDIVHALLKRLDIEYPGDSWKEASWPNAWGEGLEITGSAVVDKVKFQYVFRIAQQGQLVHLHAGWADAKKGDIQKVRKALDAIELLTPEATPSTPSGSDAKNRSMAFLFNDIGIRLYSRKEYRKAAGWFLKASGLVADDHAMLGNYVDALNHDGKNKEALEYLSERIAGFKSDPGLHLRHANLLADSGDTDGGNRAFVAAIEAGLTDENDALGWLQKLNGAEQYAQALVAAEAWMRKFPGVDSRRWHAQTVSYSGDTQAAIQLFEKLASDFPEDRRVSYDLAEMLNDAEEYARSAKLAEKLLADGKDNPRALMVLGWSQMGRKWYRDAKATFEKAAKLQPDEENIQDALRKASAMLGQGDNSDMKSPIIAVGLPDSIKELVDSHQPPSGYGEGLSSVVLLSAKGYQFDKNRPLRRTWHRKVRICNTEGVNDYSSIEHTFHPMHERIFINQVTIHDEQGNVTSPADITDNAYVMDLDDGNATHRKKLHFQIPGLRPGCMLEYQVTIEDLSRADRFPFERYTFSDSAADVVFISGDAQDQIRVFGSRVEGAVKEIKAPNLRAWVALDTSISRFEAHSSRYEDRVPVLTFAGIDQGWEKLGAEFLLEIQDRLQPDPQTSVLAKQLTEGAADDPEKVARLAGYVQKEISYTAIEFGVRARRPNVAAQTIKQKFGDCKDQALLLHQLLSAVDVECQLALVNTDWRTVPSLPTLDQFNHMVVHVPCLGNGRLVDTTNSHLHLDKWQADHLWHSHALLLDQKKTRLLPPQNAPAKGSSLIESERRVKVVSERSWEVNERLTSHGYYAAWLREAFAGLDKARVLQKAQAMMEKHLQVQVQDAHFESLENPRLPAVLHLSYLMPGAIHVDGEILRANLPAVWEMDYVEMPFVKDRRTPFDFRYPFQMRSKMSFEGMPESFSKALQSYETQMKGRDTSSEFRLDASKGTPVLMFDFSVSPTSGPAADYGRWQNEWTAPMNVYERPVSWKP